MHCLFRPANEKKLTDQKILVIQIFRNLELIKNRKKYIRKKLEMLLEKILKCPILEKT